MINEEERSFTAKNLEDLTDLTSRQVNDWDARGAIPHGRSGSKGWRKYSVREIFALVVCAELRRQFGIPVEKLKYITGEMLKEGMDDFGTATQWMALLGVDVWLVTDFSGLFMIDTELELIDVMENGGFRGAGTKGLIWLRLNDLVNRILSNLPDPISLPTHGKGYELINEVRKQFGASNAREFRLLSDIRSGDYESIEVISKDGEVSRIITKQRHETGANIAALLESKDFQSVMITKTNGSVVSVVQEVSEKLTK